MIEPPPVRGWVRTVWCPEREGPSTRAGHLPNRDSICLFCGGRVHTLSVRGKRWFPFTQDPFVIREEKW